MTTAAKAVGGPKVLAAIAVSSGVVLDEAVRGVRSFVTKHKNGVEPTFKGGDVLLILDYYNDGKGVILSPGDVCTVIRIDGKTVWLQKSGCNVGMISIPINKLKKII